MTGRRGSTSLRELSIVTNFRRLAGCCLSECALKLLLTDVAAELGFDFFALVAAVSLQRTSPFICRLDTYPESWVVQLIGQRLYIDDPILHACRSAVSGSPGTKCRPSSPCARGIGQFCMRHRGADCARASRFPATFLSNRPAPALSRRAGRDRSRNGVSSLPS